MARPKKRRRPLRVPYWGALKACAYANLPYPRAINILTGYDFLVPRFDENLRALYRNYRNEAKEIDDNFDLSPRIIHSLGIDPMYSWVKAAGNPMINERSKYITRLLDEIRHPILRRSVDILLFVGRSYDDIADVLTRQCDSPVPEWSSEDVEAYSNLFWDTTNMSIHDWTTYGTWWEESTTEYPWNYIFLFPTASTADLLWEAGISPDLSRNQICDLMLHECFVRFKEKIRSDDNQGALQFMDAYRRLLDVVKKGAHQTGSGTSQRRLERLGEALDRAEVLFKDEDSAEPISRTELVVEGQKINVSPRDAMEINPVVIEEKLDGDAPSDS